MLQSIQFITSVDVVAVVINPVQNSRLVPKEDGVVLHTHDQDFLSLFAGEGAELNKKNSNIVTVLGNIC